MKMVFYILYHFLNIKNDKVIPFELFFEVKYGEKAEYNKCDDFLYGFKLCRVIYVTAYSVCGNLKTVLLKNFDDTTIVKRSFISMPSRKEIEDVHNFLREFLNVVKN